MAFTTDDFNKIWASTSPLTPYDFSESNYKDGWNFVGATPPSRQMWDSIQQLNDEKLQYLYNVGDGFLEKLIGAFSSDLDSLPAGTAFTATTALSKMIAEMNTEDGVAYDFSNITAWYICLGAKYGGLIIQGGVITTPSTSTFDYKPYPVSFLRNPCVSFVAPSVTSSASAHVSTQYAGSNTQIGVLASAGSSWVSVNISYIAIGI